MTEEKDKSMQWKPAYVSDTAGLPLVKGYTCSHCGYFSYRKETGCPFCKRPSSKAGEHDNA